VNADIITVKIGKITFYIWDYTAQEQFIFLLEEFLVESDAILLVTESTSENIEKSKYFLEILKTKTPDVSVGVIANKQDLIKAIDVKEIEKILEFKTYSMIAIDPINRKKMIQIIAELLNMSQDVSHQLKLLDERDNLRSYLEQVITDNDFEFYNLALYLKSYFYINTYRFKFLVIINYLYRTISFLNKEFYILAFSYTLKFKRLIC